MASLADSYNYDLMANSALCFGICAFLLNLSFVAKYKYYQKTKGNIGDAVKKTTAEKIAHVKSVAGQVGAALYDSTAPLLVFDSFILSTLNVLLIILATTLKLPAGTYQAGYSDSTNQTRQGIYISAMTLGAFNVIAWATQLYVVYALRNDSDNFFGEIVEAASDTGLGLKTLAGDTLYMGKKGVDKLRGRG